MIAAIVAAVNAITACGGDGKFELAFRARDSDRRVPQGQCVMGAPDYFDEALQWRIFECVSTTTEREWVAADGRRAVTPPATEVMFLPNNQYGEIPCGGRTVPLSWWNGSRAELPPMEVTFELVIDDGNTLTLDEDSILWAVDSAGTSKCVEASGSWRGTDGDLRGRTGRFTIVDDSIQSVLRLVED